MKILETNPNNPNPKVISEAVNVLKKGGVIVYPTDTCYGLGADMTNPIAVEKIYRIKGRDDRKPLSVIVNGISTIKKIAIISENQEKILRQYLPGPFTFIILSSNYYNFAHSSIAARIPKYELTSILAEKFALPFATTSANISGFEPCYSLDCLQKQFGKSKYKPDLIIDVGKLHENPPSTIVDLTKPIPRVVRQGSGEFKE